jgi:hypothetical protein
MDSGRSTCSSIFDSAGTTTRRSGIWSTSSHEGSSPTQPTLKNQFFQNLAYIDEKSVESSAGEEIFSQYEPVNNILCKLQQEKRTFRKLNTNYSTLTTEQKRGNYEMSYFQYWAMSEEQIQVLQMLEPEVVTRQLRLFQLYQQVKLMALDLRQIIDMEIPLLKKYARLDDLFTVYNAISPVAGGLYYEMRYIMEGNIVIRGNVISTLINESFKELAANKDRFARSIAAVIAYEDSLVESPTSPLLARCNFRLFHFDSVLTFQTLDNTEISINEAHRYAIEIEDTIQVHYRGIKRHEMNRQFLLACVNVISGYVIELPLFLTEALVILPFVILCWALFSAKSLVTAKRVRTESITAY